MKEAVLPTGVPVRLDEATRVALDCTQAGSPLFSRVLSPVQTARKREVSSWECPLLRCKWRFEDLGRGNENSADTNELP